MLESANVIRVQLASYAFEEVFSQPPLRVKDGETRWASISFWKRYIVWKKYCNTFCKTLNTGTLPRNPPFHWKAELIFKSYRLQECRNFLVHQKFSCTKFFLVASILFQPFLLCFVFSSKVGLRYIERPLLVAKKKCDLRLWVFWLQKLGELSGDVVFFLWTIISGPQNLGG